MFAIACRCWGGGCLAPPCFARSIRASRAIRIPMRFLALFHPRHIGFLARLEAPRSSPSFRCKSASDGAGAPGFAEESEDAWLVGVGAPPSC